MDGEVALLDSSTSGRASLMDKTVAVGAQKIKARTLIFEHGSYVMEFGYVNEKVTDDELKELAATFTDFLDGLK